MPFQTTEEVQGETDDLMSSGKKDRGFEIWGTGTILKELFQIFERPGGAHMGLLSV